MKKMNYTQQYALLRDHYFLKYPKQTEYILQMCLPGKDVQPESWTRKTKKYILTSTTAFTIMKSNILPLKKKSTSHIFHQNYKITAFARAFSHTKLNCPSVIVITFSSILSCMSPEEAAKSRQWCSLSLLSGLQLT